jgi:hypothetical protein
MRGGDASADGTGRLEGFSLKAGGVQAWGPSELFFRSRAAETDQARRLPKAFQTSKLPVHSAEPSSTAMVAASTNPHPSPGPPQLPNSLLVAESSPPPRCPAASPAASAWKRAVSGLGVLLNYFFRSRAAETDQARRLPNAFQTSKLPVHSAEPSSTAMVAASTNPHPSPGPPQLPNSLLVAESSPPRDAPRSPQPHEPSSQPEQGRCR